MAWHSKCWMAFMIDGKVRPAYIADWNGYDVLKAKYGEHIPVSRYGEDRDWKTEEECEKEIDEYLFEKWFSETFRTDYQEPLTEAIHKNGEEVNSGTKIFFERFSEITLHTFARMAWREGLLLELNLVPREEG